MRARSSSFGVNGRDSVELGDGGPDSGRCDSERYAEDWKVCDAFVCGKSVADADVRRGSVVLLVLRARDSARRRALLRPLRNDAADWRFLASCLMLAMFVRMPHALR